MRHVLTINSAKKKLWGRFGTVGTNAKELKVCYVWWLKPRCVWSVQLTFPFPPTHKVSSAACTNSSAEHTESFSPGHGPQSIPTTTHSWFSLLLPSLTRAAPCVTHADTLAASNKSPKFFSSEPQSSNPVLGWFSPLFPALTSPARCSYADIGAAENKSSFMSSKPQSSNPAALGWFSSLSLALTPFFLTHNTLRHARADCVAPGIDDSTSYIWPENEPGVVFCAWSVPPSPALTPLFLIHNAFWHTRADYVAPDTEHSTSYPLLESPQSLAFTLARGQFGSLHFS